MKTRIGFRVCLAVLLMVLWLGTAASAPPVLANAQNASLSVESLLNPDGTLDLSHSANSSLDLRGWNVTLDSTRGPVLAREQNVPAAFLDSWLAFPHNGLDEAVHDIVVSEGDIYVGGRFTASADGTVTNLNNIAKFSGGAWHALPNNGLNSEVRELALDGDTLYAAGFFQATADGAVTDLRYIAKLDLLTNTWTAFPNKGLNGVVQALAVSGSDLYAGGDFTRTFDSTVELNHIAKLSGGAWSTLSDNGLNNSVVEMAVSGGDLYVGGLFQQTGNGGVTELNYIAKYSGDTWVQFPNSGLNGSVHDLVISGSNLYVGGSFTADGTVSNHIAKFDLSTSAWSLLPNNGLNNQVTALTVIGDDLYVGGIFTQTADGTITNLNRIAKYSNGAWSQLPNNGLNNYPLALAVGGNEVYVGGTFTRTFDETKTLDRIAKLSSQTPPTSCPGTWNTFIGSSSAYDEPRAITLDADCNVYVVGNSNASWGSPVDAYAGSVDAFVAKFNSDGALQWNTFMGSSGFNDHGAAIAVDGNGNVYVTGISFGSWGNPIDPHAGGYQTFIVKLNSSGIREWNTFLGGPGQSGDGYGIAVDGFGNIYVTGESRSNWGTSPIEPYHGVWWEIYVAKLNTNGTRQWHTFLGSTAKDTGMEIALDSSGNIYVAGYSEASWGTPRNAYTGGGDAVAAKLYSDGTLAWNTFMGSSASEWGYGIAADESGNVYVSGDSAASWGSPIVGHSDGTDGFAAKLNSSGDRQWSTFFGSATQDNGHEMSIDESANVFVAGSSDATWGNPISPFAGPRDAFLVKLNTSGVRVWNTFIGSAADDVGNDVAVDASGGAFVAGYSQSRWESGLKPEANENDGFISKLSATPTAATLLSFTARAATERVAVKWTTGSELSVIGFNVWRRQGNQGEFQKLNAALIPAQNPGGVVGSQYTYNDDAVQAGKTYRYKLEVLETNNKSEWSDVVKITMPAACTGAPDKPTPVGPTDGKTIKTLRANLKWQAVNCATSYEIVVRQGKRDGKIVDQAKDLTTTQYKTIVLKAGKTYVWRVRACSANECGKWSAWQSFTTQADTPP